MLFLLHDVVTFLKSSCTCEERGGGRRLTDLGKEKTPERPSREGRPQPAANREQEEAGETGNVCTDSMCPTSAQTHEGTYTHTCT